MVLACVAMLLIPRLWESGTTPATGSAAEAEEASGAADLPGQSTLTGEDLAPAWRGPGARRQKDG